MKHEKSCGGLIYREHEGETHILLLKHRCGGHWSFPKGHMEAGETEMETALREIREETGLRVFLREGFREAVEYSPKPNVKNRSFILSDSPLTNPPFTPRKRRFLSFSGWKFTQLMKPLPSATTKTLSQKRWILSTAEECKKKKRARKFFRAHFLFCRMLMRFLSVICVKNFRHNIADGFLILSINHYGNKDSVNFRNRHFLIIKFSFY